MEKLLATLFFIQRARGRRLFQRLLPNIIMVIGLMIIISIIVSALLIGGLVAGYFTLIHYGMEPQAAMITIAISTLLTIVMLVLLTLSCLQRLRQIPQTLLEESPLISRAMETLNAFTDGLMAE